MLWCTSASRTRGTISFVLLVMGFGTNPMWSRSHPFTPSPPPAPSRDCASGSDSFASPGAIAADVAADSGRVHASEMIHQAIWRAKGHGILAVITACNIHETVGFDEASAGAVTPRGPEPRQRETP